MYFQLTVPTMIRRVNILKVSIRYGFKFLLASCQEVRLKAVLLFR
jgi:hypothetical protein